MNIDWDLIKEKYQKGYENYLQYIFEKNKIINIMWDEDLYENIEDLIKKSCYCDLEKFFDDNGIIIEINYWHINCFNFDITNSKTNKILYEQQLGEIKTRQKAKEQVIYKAFEILEEKI